MPSGSKAIARQVGLASGRTERSRDSWRLVNAPAGFGARALSVGAAAPAVTRTTPASDGAGFSVCSPDQRAPATALLLR